MCFGKPNFTYTTIPLSLKVNEKGKCVLGNSISSNSTGWVGGEGRTRSMQNPCANYARLDGWSARPKLDVGGWRGLYLVLYSTTLVLRSTTYYYFSTTLYYLVLLSTT